MSSTLNFLDLNGNDLKLTLQDADYSTDAVITGSLATVNAFIFKFVDSMTSKIVYVYVPVKETGVLTYPA
jgi:hypothetical protein